MAAGGGPVSDCGCKPAAVVVGAKKTRTKVKVETEKTEVVAAAAAATPAEAPEPCAPAITVTKSRYAACRFAAAKIGAIDTTEKVNALVGSYLAKEDQEVCLVIPLDVHYKLRRAPAEIARGARSGVQVSYVEILRVIAATGASKIVLAHNHPGNSPKPSAADRKFTRGVDKALKVATNGEVVMLDHVIFTSTQYHSIRERKTFKR
jgi:DNA repair protein RadC